MTERTVCMSGALPRKPGSGCYRGPPRRPQGPAVLRMPNKAKRSPGGRAVPGTGCEDRPRGGAHGRPFLQGPLLQAPRRDGPGPCPQGQPQSSLAGVPETTQQNVCREGEGGRAVFARISNAWLKGDKNPTFQRRGKEGVWRAGEQAHILCGELVFHCKVHSITTLSGGRSRTGSCLRKASSSSHCYRSWLRSISRG